MTSDMTVSEISATICPKLSNLCSLINRRISRKFCITLPIPTIPAYVKMSFHTVVSGCEFSKERTRLQNPCVKRTCGNK